MDIDYEELASKLRELARKQGLKDGRKERIGRVAGAAPITNPYERDENGGDAPALELLKKLRIPRPQDEVDTLRSAMTDGWESGFEETLAKTAI